MFNYGKYGPKSSFTTFIPENELREINPQELTDLIKDLYSYKHRLFYYGKMSPEKVKPQLEEFHKIPSELKEYPVEMSFAPVDNEENKVFIVDYDMVQANIILMAKDEKLNMDLLPVATLFSEYFGSGLSSIVFQEIREARALAYSAFASYNVPALKDEYHFVYGFVGTQADKLKTATDALLDLMNNMPKAEKQFNLAKETIRKQIQTERITRQNIYYTYLTNLDRGVSHDTRKDVYDGIQDMSLDELENFFNEHIAGNNYTFLILADEKNLDMGVLKELGRIEKLSLEEIFGY
jgi:predicted Zn-dependent peptidase